MGCTSFTGKLKHTTNIHKLERIQTRIRLSFSDFESAQKWANRKAARTCVPRGAARGMPRRVPRWQAARRAAPLFGVYDIHYTSGSPDTFYCLIIPRLPPIKIYFSFLHLQN